MHLTVISHKVCWPDRESASGFATDGGFPFQMRALAGAFDSTAICLPVKHASTASGGSRLEGKNLTILPLTPPAGKGIWRKLALPVWFLRNAPTLITQMRRTDAIHAPIPGDIGTIGMLLAFSLRKPLFVRYCGNWAVERTPAERFWKWFLQRYAGTRNVVLATGGAAESPSATNPNIRWIFSSSLTQSELDGCACVRDIRQNDQIRLIISGRQERGKGTDLLIQTLPILQRTFPNMSLEVVGDGAALPHFRSLAREMGVEDKVHFHGRVTHGQVIQLLRQSDLFCFPTQSEGFPKAVLEALACGLPVITTPVSVLPMLIGQGCGYLLDTPTPESLARTIGECLSDPEGYQRMSQKAMEVARQFSLEKWRDTIADLLRNSWGQLAKES